MTRADAAAARPAPPPGSDEQLVSDRCDLVDARNTAAAIGLDGPVSAGRPTLRRSLAVAAAGGLAVAMLVPVGWDVVRARRRAARRRAARR